MAHLITARARKNKHTARMLENASKDHSTPLRIKAKLFHQSLSSANEIHLHSLVPRMQKLYWQRNGGFKLWPEVKITRLIDIFSVVFSNQVFSLKADMGNLSDCPQILTHKLQKLVCEFFLSKYFFNERDFCTNSPYFFNPISKMFCNFSLKLNIANRSHLFSALWARKLRDPLIKQKTKLSLTCNVQKVIRALAFKSREKFDNSFLFKIVRIASPHDKL